MKDETWWDEWKEPLERVWAAVLVSISLLGSYATVWVPYRGKGLAGVTAVVLLVVTVVLARTRRRKVRWWLPAACAAGGVAFAALADGVIGAMLSTGWLFFVGIVWLAVYAHRGRRTLERLRIRLGSPDASLVTLNDGIDNLRVLPVHVETDPPGEFWKSILELLP